MREGQRILDGKGVHLPYELTYLEGDLMEDYLHDMRLVQEFAGLNCAAMFDELLRGMKWKAEDTWSSIHNYVDFDTELEGGSSGKALFPPIKGSGSSSLSICVTG